MNKKNPGKSFCHLIVNGPINNSLQFWLLKKKIIVKPLSLTKKSKNQNKLFTSILKKKNFDSNLFCFKIDQIEKKMYSGVKCPTESLQKISDHLKKNSLKNRKNVSGGGGITDKCPKSSMPRWGKMGRNYYCFLKFDPLLAM